MKKILFIIGLLHITLSCKTQMIPIEEHIHYLDNEIEIPDGTYIKDVNNKLDKFVGVWRGQYNKRNYEFKVIKIIHHSRVRDFMRDKLMIKYKITKMNGDIIENTMGVSDISDLIIDGRYLSQSGAYVLYYHGKDAICGQSGDIYISVHQSNHNKMSFKLLPEGDIVLEEDCPNGEAEQYFPIEANGLTLTKQ